MPTASVEQMLLSYHPLSLLVTGRRASVARLGNLAGDAADSSCGWFPCRGRVADCLLGVGGRFGHGVYTAVLLVICDLILVIFYTSSYADYALSYTNSWSWTWSISFSSYYLFSSMCSIC